MQRYPKDCYFIHGPAGSGKTHFSIALLENAISDWAWICFQNGYADRTFFRVPTKTWVDEIFAWRYQRPNDDEDAISIPKPALNVESIERLSRIPGVHICVIFDEIDKFGVTDKRLVELFEITNALSEVGAQMIATSNHSPEELKKRWNSGHSDAILRRFYDSTGGEARHMLACTP
jgi:DNA replication protein DnaC